MKGIKLSVYWPDDHKSVVLTAKEYQNVLNGEEFIKTGLGYSYEGDLFQDIWWFEGGMDGAIEVTYDDGGTGFSGKLSDAEIEIQ